MHARAWGWYNTRIVTNGEKTELRREMAARRKALPAEERKRASEAVCRSLADDDALAAAVLPPRGHGALAVYLASPFEIDLSAFVERMLRLGAVVVSPRWNGETYELARLKSLDDGALRRGPMGILEPADADIVDPANVAAWIVPGLAFTTDGRRLGYGGGWYDRLLALSSATSMKIGVAHDFQIVGDLPCEAHDVPVDRVVRCRLRRLCPSTSSCRSPLAP